MLLQNVNGIVLAAGFGTRLKPMTDSIPKALVEVAGQPLIFYALQNMMKAKIPRVVITTHYLSDQIVDKVSSKKWPFDIVFSHEPMILGTGGGIRKALEYLPDAQAVLVQNADAIITNDVSELIANHELGGALSTMLLKSVPNPDEYGAVLTDKDNCVRDIVGRAGYLGEVANRSMFCGMQVLSPKIRQWMPDKLEFCILKDVVVPAILDNALVRGFENAGYFCDVGTPERLKSANDHFAKRCLERTSFDNT